ncbi:MAG: hypothetical protein JRI54_10710 [Deltaproteobacteria bacterium]|nr:hypothetical protein [Deltaproteobacteria bacterium]
MKRSISVKHDWTRGLLAAAVACLLVFSGAMAWATPLNYDLYGVTFPVSANLVLDYNPSTSTLAIDLTNTSTVPVTSSITAFAFNVPAEVSGINSYIFPSNWSVLPSLYTPDTIPGNSINTPGNFGFFDVAGVTNSTSGFNGGTVSSGIPQNDTFSFSIEFSGTNLNTLTTGSFYQLSAPQNSNSNLQPFIARFQGIDFGSGEDESDVAIVPIPAAILLFGPGLLGLAGLRRKFRA